MSITGPRMARTFWLVCITFIVGGCAGNDQASQPPSRGPATTTEFEATSHWVDVADLARDAGLAYDVDSTSGRHRLKRGNSVAAEFETASRVAYVDGQLFVLERRPESRGGRTYIPRSFAERVASTTTRPSSAPSAVVKPIPAGGALAARRFVIDAGHGGKDPGTSAGKVIEKTIVLDVSRRVARLLREAGAEVVEVRTDDTFYSLDERVAIADRSRADAFVSIHVNAAENKKASGVEIFRPSRKEAGQDPRKLARSAVLANAVFKRLAAVSPGSDRGVKANDRGLRVVRKPKGPAILIEMGFVSNADERRLLTTDAYRTRLAEAIYQGLRDWAATD